MSETIIEALKRATSLKDAKTLIKLGIDPCWTFDSPDFKEWQERTGIEIAGIPGV